MMKTILALRRFTLVLIAVLGVASPSWADAIDFPAVLDELGVDAVMDAAPTLAQDMDLRLKPLIVGDVNDDGTMDISDATTLISYLLYGENPNVINGDVDEDGSISISDATNLINRLLNGIVETHFSTTELANAMKTLYRKLHTAGWTTNGNTHHCFGISAYTLAAEVMGDDMVMSAQGNGWFWYDASYNEKQHYNSTYWRSYDLWTAYYTCIAEANSIIGQKDAITGDNNLVNYYVGQAYAIRAYSYFMLAQWFARTYKGHESEPCVPLFTGYEFSYPTGQGRATVAQVYAQIDADIQQATTLLQGKTQLRKDHISYAVAMGLKARIALVKEDWSGASTAATNAINASGSTILEVSGFAGLNDTEAANVMWGAVIPANEVGMYASLWAHMDPNGGYYIRSAKQITPWLYNKMSATDARRAWWSSNSSNNTGSYDTQKFKVKEGTEWEGDYIYMRVEEMYLIAAEAACRRGLTTSAKNYLTQLMAKRDPNYTCNKTGTSLGALTTEETGSLLEEILIQRRLELWGEDGRIMTIRRLHQGFERTTENGWPSGLLLSGKVVSDPESYAWVMTIPQAEFNGNANMNPEFIPVGDQNPIGDVTGVGQNVSFETATSSLTTARTDFYYDVTLTRASTVGEYVTSVSLANPVDGLSVTGNVTFPDGSNTVKARVYCYPLTLGQTYSGKLMLSDYDVACYSGGTQLSSHTFTIHCQNGNPSGQKISFEQASTIEDTEDSRRWIPVTLTRDRTDNEYSATLILSTDDPSVVTMSNQNVFFAEGASTASTTVYFNNMEIGQTYSCVVSLSPEDVATGGEITSTQITVTRSNWVTMGTCVYEAGLLGDSYNLTVQRDGGNTTRYRMVNFVYEGCNIVFTINGSNQVFIESQPCFEYPDYGTCYMIGYANADDSSYAGTYDPNTKRADLQVRYYFPGIGAWPTSSDVLIMP
ncbi:MAG: RagB/SusD family nutrient uptake outer membrane protein [Muribaculaceae bacterium]|nr:RagB/SusD family nutrient uptake outer membrane protein [Muribaculaceae bacterium]